MPDKSKPAKSPVAKSPAAKPDASGKPGDADASTSRTIKLVKPATGNQAVVVRKPRATAAIGLPVLPRGERSRLVAESAYLIAERRGFRTGEEQADWFEAERRIDAAYRFA